MNLGEDKNADDARKDIMLHPTIENKARDVEAAQERRKRHNHDCAKTDEVTHGIIVENADLEALALECTLHVLRRTKAVGSGAMSSLFLYGGLLGTEPTRKNRTRNNRSALVLGGHRILCSHRKSGRLRRHPLYRAARPQWGQVIMDIKITLPGTQRPQSS